MTFPDRLFLLWAYIGFLAGCGAIACGFEALWVRWNRPMATRVKR